MVKSAAENPVVFLNESKAENQTLRAENIAVLVRGYTEAELVKKIASTRYCFGLSFG